MLRHRLIFGVLMGAVLIGLCVADAALPWDGVLLSLAFVGLAAAVSHELGAMASGLGARASRFELFLWIVVGLACGRTASETVGVTSGVMAYSALLVLIGLATIRHGMRFGAPGLAASIGLRAFALVYAGIGGGLLLALASERTAWAVLAVLAVTKFGDIGAYAVGSRLGRTPLAPRISPKKTVEGLVGGVAASGLVGVVLAVAVGEEVTMHRGTHIGLPAWVLGAFGGALIGLTGVMGDLVVSVLKRGAGQKDASRLVPGFGGVLDVVDSPLLAGVAGWWLLAGWA